MSTITSVGIAVPENRFDQSDIGKFMVNAMQLDYENSRKLQAVFRSSGIMQRYSVLEDYGKEEDFSFYPNTHDFEPFPSTEKRLTCYQQHAVKLSLTAVNDCIAKQQGFDLKSITHLIVVSCTGMYAPGLDIDLVQQLSLRYDVQRLSINFMGCYAAFNAIKAGDAFCKADPKAKVLIVCVELCSIHFQKQPTEDNMLANALFADGAAALIMQSQPCSGVNLTPSAFHNALSFTKEPQMAWRVGDLGFEMKLTSYVPQVIQGGIKKLTEEMLVKIGKNFSDIKHFAIHPGGKKILEVIERELGISHQDNRYAYNVLNRYGNMSSATVLFVLNNLLQEIKPENNGEDVLTFAFGPGLTLESILLTIQYA
jgi:predicted naringenin-chalcone synthase